MRTVKLILAVILGCAAVHAQSCPSGFISIVDPFLNPDGSSWTGTITYTLAYNTTVAGATVAGAKQTFNVTSGISRCLAPGLYAPVVLQQSGQRNAIANAWGVPVNGGPYTIAQIQGNITLQGTFGSVVLSGTPSSGQVPVATGATTAIWNQVPADGGISGLLPHANIAATAVTPGNYTNANITVAADGSITAAADGTVGACSTCLLSTNNLSDVASAAASRTNLGLAAVAASGSASDLSTGTLNAALLPAFAGGDVTSSAGSAVLLIGSARVTNAMLAGSIAASKLVGTDISTLGTVTTGIWNATPVGLNYGGTGQSSNGSAFQPLVSLGGSSTQWGSPNATLTAIVGSVVDGDCAQAGSITLTGATLGDAVFAGVNINLPSGVNAIAKVTAANTVTVEVCNLSESAYSVPSATYKVEFLR